MSDVLAILERAGRLSTSTLVIAIICALVWATAARLTTVVAPSLIAADASVAVSIIALSARLWPTVRKQGLRLAHHFALRSQFPKLARAWVALPAEAAAFMISMSRSPIWSISRNQAEVPFLQALIDGGFVEKDQRNNGGWYPYVVTKAAIAFMRHAAPPSGTDYAVWPAQRGTSQLPE